MSDHVQQSGDLQELRKGAKRVALVIGNQGVGQTEIRGDEDAKAMATALERLGFEVVGPLCNPEEDEMLAAIEGFGDQILEAEQVVFFFSGHGYQIQGLTHMLPAGEEIDLEKPQVPITKVIEALNAAPKALRFIFLDACRTSEDLKVKGGTTLGKIPGYRPGLAAHTTDLQELTLISYSAGPGQLAYSGERDALSPYSQALVSAIVEPGLEVRELLEQVHHQVRTVESSGQAPHDGNLATIPYPFYFRPPVELDMWVKSANDGVLVFLDGKLVLSSTSQDSRSAKLYLNAGEHDLLVMVSNSKSFRSSQTWQLPDGWHYELGVEWPPGAEIFCGPEGGSVDCFKDAVPIPFKSGPQHGGVFPVATAKLCVDKATAVLTATVDKKPLRQIPEWALDQEILWESSLSDLPLEENEDFQIYLGIINGLKFLLELAGLSDKVALPDTKTIFALVVGNRKLKELVEVCMDERWDERLDDLAESMAKTLSAAETKPFDSFDEALNECLREEAERRGWTDLEDIRVWTALQQRRDAADS